MSDWKGSDGTDKFRGAGDWNRSVKDFDQTFTGGPAPGSSTHTERTRRSYGSRLGGALSGVIVGILLIPAAIGALFWNEGRAVQTARSLAEGGAAVEAVPAERVDPAMNGRLIHLSGALVPTGAPPRDPEFGVTGGGAPNSVIRIERRVEMFQWREESRSETRTNMGGSQETITTYRYAPVWAADRIDSSRFRQPDGHQNPALRVPSHSFLAEAATLGAFRLSADQLRGWGEEAAYPLDAAAGAQRGFQVVDGRIHQGDPANPRIGDLRIAFAVVRAGDASVVARQDGPNLTTYQTRAGDGILMIESGRRSAAEMFRAAEQANTMMTWIIRVVGLVLMWVGFATILNPLRVLADVIPFLGRVVGAGTALVGLLLTVLVGPATIAIAWLTYRPLIGGAVLAAGLVLTVLLWRAARGRAARRAAAMPPPGMAPAGIPPGWSAPPPGWQPPR
jgi:hypothetical protein